MESCLKRFNCSKVLPRRAYNTFGWLSLRLFVVTGVVIVGTAIPMVSREFMLCNPDKTLASDLSTRKYVETQCFLKYVEEFYPVLPLHQMFAMNIGLVLSLTIIYAYIVKDRVESFVEPARETANGGQEESQPLSISGNMSQGVLDPNEHQGSSHNFVFKVYILHLIICRILPLLVFAALLYKSVKFPTQFGCPWPINSMSTSNVNVTQSQGRNVSIVNCIYSMGRRSEMVSVAVISVDLLFATEAFIELVYLLWSSWKDRSFVSDREFCSVYLLRKRKGITKVINKLRDNLFDKKIYVHDDCDKINDSNINAIIQAEGWERSSTSRRPFKYMHEFYETHLKKPKDAISLSKASDLFKPIGTTCSYPRTILVVGRPRIGKTFLMEKIFHEWQEQAYEFWHNKIVVLIQFRSFNHAKTNLRKMLEHAHGLSMLSCDFNFMYQYICESPRNAVFIFDGLDELKCDENSLIEETAVSDPSQEGNILHIFIKLVKGKLLPGVTVLTTSRPKAEDIYKQLQFDQEVEILGFHKEQIKSYVEKFCCNDKDKSKRLWKIIEQSPEYLSLSYIPVNCYIICSTLKEIIDANEPEDAEAERSQSNVPRTVTELYKRAMKILLFRYYNEYKGEPIPKDYIIAKHPAQFQKSLDHLKEMARKDMVEDQWVFEIESDNKYAEKSGCSRVNNVDGKNHFFHFVYVKILEFLAAQHVVDDLEHVESFLTDHIDNPKWHLVIQFVAGLIGDKIRKLEKERNESESSATELTNDARIIEDICKRFQAWMPKDGKIDGDHRKLLVIKCVHEMKEVGVRKLMTSFVYGENSENYDEFRLNNLTIAPTESAALFEFFGHIKNLQFLNIQFCTMEHSAFRELANLLTKDNKIKDLTIEDCRMSDDDAKHVIDALRNENCKVTRLVLAENNLTARSAKYLRNTLKSGTCKLTELNVSGNELNDHAAEYLSEALKSGKGKLNKLYLYRNELEDAGGKYLCDALMSGICELEVLDIGGNKLTDKSVECLGDLLDKGNCNLTTLFMSGCKLTNEGKQYLRDVFKCSSCYLTID